MNGSSIASGGGGRMTKRMNSTPDQNQVAFRKMKATIDKTYSKGRFLAIGAGRIIADAPNFDELASRVRSLGKNPKEMLIVQAGVEYPETGIILAQNA